MSETQSQNRQLERANANAKQAERAAAEARDRAAEDEKAALEAARAGRLQPDQRPAMQRVLALAAPPKFGDDRSQRRYQDTCEAALASQAVPFAIAPGCSVRTLKGRTLQAGEPVTPADVTAGGLALMRGIGAVLELPMHDALARMPIGKPTHRVRPRRMLSTPRGPITHPWCVSPDDFAPIAYQAAQPEVPATLRWNGEVVMGRQGQFEVKAQSVKEQLAALVADGTLEVIQGG